jgi:hypothetical protein
MDAHQTVAAQHHRMTEHLSPAELIALTGARTVLAQVRWLTQNHLPFKYNGMNVYVSRLAARERVEPEGARLDLVR